MKAVDTVGLGGVDALANGDLFSGQGFLRAVGFLLAVTLAAIGAGVWGGAPGTASAKGSRSTDPPQPVE